MAAAILSILLLLPLQPVPHRFVDESVSVCHGPESFQQIQVEPYGYGFLAYT